LGGVLNVLVLDDEEIVLFYFKTFLGTMNVSTKTTSSVDEALEIIHSGWVDLLITDIKMPEMSGFDLIDKIRKEGHNFMIIVESGYLENDERMQFYKDNVFAFIPKPIDLNNLESVMDQAIKVYQSSSSIS
jgi:DNA-binding NtrC family response regulator